MDELFETARGVAAAFADGWAALVPDGVPTPWVLAAVVGLVVLGRLTRSGPRREPRDPVRTFPRADKAVVLHRAGGQCEHHSLIAGRCPERWGLEADHVHPHSRGGSTALANGQALCRLHNKAKGASVPSDRELRRLARRREAYFPAGHAPEVVRRGSQSTGSPRYVPKDQRLPSGSISRHSREP